jgi:hypothetical protein
MAVGMLLPIKVLWQGNWLLCALYVKESLFLCRHTPVATGLLDS